MFILIITHAKQIEHIYEWRYLAHPLYTVIPHFLTNRIRQKKKIKKDCFVLISLGNIILKSV